MYIFKFSFNMIDKIKYIDVDICLPHRYNESLFLSMGYVKIKNTELV